MFLMLGNAAACIVTATILNLLDRGNARVLNASKHTKAKMALEQDGDFDEKSLLLPSGEKSAGIQR